jgi:hypothetical protein
MMNPEIRGEIMSDNKFEIEDNTPFELTEKNVVEVMHKINNLYMDDEAMHNRNARMQITFLDTHPHPKFPTSTRDPKGSLLTCMSYREEDGETGLQIRMLRDGHALSTDVDNLIFPMGTTFEFYGVSTRITPENPDERHSANRFSTPRVEISRAWSRT